MMGGYDLAMAINFNCDVIAASDLRRRITAVPSRNHDATGLMLPQEYKRLRKGFV
jgi:hypothetical protein